MARKVDAVRPGRRDARSPSDLFGAWIEKYSGRMAKLDASKRTRLPDSAFAYIDSRGKRGLPIHDESHVRNALARFNQVRFEDDAARERARKRLLTAAKKYGIVPIGFMTGQIEAERTHATAGRLVIEHAAGFRIVVALEPHHAAHCWSSRVRGTRVQFAGGWHRIPSRVDRPRKYLLEWRNPRDVSRGYRPEV